MAFADQDLLKTFETTLQNVVLYDAFDTPALVEPNIQSQALSLISQIEERATHCGSAASLGHISYELMTMSDGERFLLVGHAKDDIYIIHAYDFPHPHQAAKDEYLLAKHMDLGMGVMNYSDTIMQGALSKSALAMFRLVEYEDGECMVPKRGVQPVS